MSQASGGPLREPDEAAPALTRREVREAQKAKKSRRTRRGSLLSVVPEWLKVGVVAVALMVLVRAFLVQSFSVPSGSMQQTMSRGTASW